MKKCIENDGTVISVQPVEDGVIVETEYNSEGPGYANTYIFLDKDNVEEFIQMLKKSIK